VLLPQYPPRHPAAAEGRRICLAPSSKVRPGDAHGNPRGRTVPRPVAASRCESGPVSVLPTRVQGLNLAALYKHAIVKGIAHDAIRIRFLCHPPPGRSGFSLCPGILPARSEAEPGATLKNWGHPLRQGNPGRLKRAWRVPLVCSCSLEQSRVRSLDPFRQAEIKATLRYSRHFATWPSECNFEWNTNTKIRAAINVYQSSPVTTIRGSSSNSSLHLAAKSMAKPPCHVSSKGRTYPMLPPRARYATMTTTTPPSRYPQTLPPPASSPNTTNPISLHHTHYSHLSLLPKHTPFVQQTSHFPPVHQQTSREKKDQPKTRICNVAQ